MPGIISLTMSEIFTRVDELNEETSFEIFMSYLEVIGKNEIITSEPIKRTLNILKKWIFFALLTHFRSIINVPDTRYCNYSTLESIA